jgi:hypothetical protein
MKKVFLMAFLLFSLNAVASKDIYISSQDTYDFYLQNVAGQPLYKRGDALSGTVVGRGKGVEYGKTLVMHYLVNCGTKQLKLDDGAWRAAKPNTLGADVVNKFCSTPMYVR